MKIFACILTFLLSLSFLNVRAQAPDSTGLPGDNLNLYAVLDLFKASASVEDFEKKLNDPNTKINNLDLNNDGYIDYIRVVDYGKDNLHSLVLQVPVNKGESQDVAVIEIEKTNDGAHIQIVGNEDLYGKDYIVEPQEEGREAQIPSQNLTPPTTQVVYVNVWAWPSVAYIYGPGYVYWSSPWYWGYYPGWWHPWRPYGWYAYHHWWYHDHPLPYYHHIYVNHIPGAYTVYAPHKTTSVYVQKNVTVVKSTGVKVSGKSAAPGATPGNAQPQQKSAAVKSPAQKSDLKSQPVNGIKTHGTQPMQQNMQQREMGTKQPVQKPVNNTVRQQQQVNRPVQQQRVNTMPQQRVQQPRINGGGQRPMRTGGGGGHMGGGGRRR